MLKVVLDTNVLVSALLNPAGIPGKVVDAALDGRYELVVSPEILDEYAEVLARAKFGFNARDLREFSERLKLAASFCFPSEAIRACRDHGDDKFLACALAGQAAYLVTGNPRDFPKGHFAGIRILSPADFISLSRLI